MGYLQATLRNVLDIASESNGSKYEVEEDYGDESFTLKLNENGEFVWMVKITKDGGTTYKDMDDAYRLMIGSIVSHSITSMNKTVS